MSRRTDPNGVNYPEVYRGEIDPWSQERCSELGERWREMDRAFDSAAAMLRTGFLAQFNDEELCLLQAMGRFCWNDYYALRNAGRSWGTYPDGIAIARADLAAPPPPE